MRELKADVAQLEELRTCNAKVGGSNPLISSKVSMNVSMNDKILITGSGRSGTTFLMHLLTECGLDTGYTGATLESATDKTNSGAEWPLQDGIEFPTIIKSPGFCIHLPSTIKRFDWNVKHVFISIRKYESVVKHHLEGLEEKEKRVREQQLIQGVAYHIGFLMEHLVFLDIPYTFIQFPRSVEDGRYLYFQLEKILKDVPYWLFMQKHKEIADKTKVRF